MPQSPTPQTARSSTPTLVIGAILALVLLFVVAGFARHTIEGWLAVRPPTAKLAAPTDDPLVSRANLARLVAPTVGPTDPSRGPLDAPITIVEFSDFACPYCAQAQEMLSALDARFPNKIRFVWKDLPIPQLHPASPLAHRAARCAQRQLKFWQFHDALFGNQDKLVQAQFLSDTALALGLNPTTFDKCLASPSADSLVQAGTDEATLLGVTGTPQFYLNGKIVENFTVEAVVPLINAALTPPKS